MHHNSSRAFFTITSGKSSEKYHKTSNVTGNIKFEGLTKLRFCLKQKIFRAQESPVIKFVRHCVKDLALRQKITMEEVAKRAGVTKMTVSRVLNSSPLVTAETQQKVRAAIEQLDYVRNDAARALRAQKSSAIGLILPSLFDPFFGVCAHVVHEEALRHHHLVITTTSDNDLALERKRAMLLARWQVDGCILVPADSQHSVARIGPSGNIPLVCFDLPLTGKKIDSVVVDNEAGGRMAVAHLLEHGHRRIAYIGPPGELYTIRTRKAGAQAEAQEHGGFIDEFAGVTDLSSAMVALRALRSQSKPPTAIFTPNNMTTKFVLRAMHELKLKIPQDMALIGFDDFELADMVTPKITVVAQSAETMARRAAQLLFERMAKPRMKLVEARLPVSLVIRESCGCNL